MTVMGSRFGNLDRFVRKQTLVWLVLAACIANLLFTGALAAAGVLETAERGDVTYLRTEAFSDGTQVVVEPDSHLYATEEPTDVDAFYNAIVRARNGGPLYNQASTTVSIQQFHYHPATYFVFLPLYFLGYAGFKIAWLLLCVTLTWIGTALLVLAERDTPGVELSGSAMGAISLAALGFGPMLTNFKTGQTTPFVFFFVGLAWWAYRKSTFSTAGIALAIAATVKPYFLAPVALGFNRNRWWLVGGFLGTYAVATVVGILQFGPETTSTYFSLLTEYAAGEASTGGSLGGTNWSASTLRLFSWLGPLSLPVRIIAFLPLAYLGVSYLASKEPDEYAPVLFGGTLVGLFVLVDSTSIVDSAVLLAVFLVLGIHTYAGDRFLPVALSFLLFHAHPWTLELLIGAGPTFVAVIDVNQDLIRGIVPLLQPGLYGFILLYGSVFAVSPPLSAPGDILQSIRDEIFDRPGQL